jgi:hypothetical protein
MTQEQIINILKEDENYKSKYEHGNNENKEIMDKLIKQLALSHTNNPTAQQNRIAEKLKTYLENHL